MNQNSLKNFLSQVNSFLPSMLAIANIFFISQMYQIVTKQNAEIIELLLNLTPKVIEEVIQPVVNVAAANPEVSIWNTIAGYAVPLGSVAICAVLLYIYFTSGSSGPGPNFPSIDIKKLEEVVSEKIEEKSNAVIEVIGHKSSEVMSVIVNKTNNIASESFIEGGFKYLLSSISQGVRSGNAESSKVISDAVKAVIDDSNTAAIDLIDSRLTDISTTVDANHVESIKLITGLKDLITSFMNSGS